MTLDRLGIGDFAQIVSVGGEGALRRRLLDMGITPNTNVMVRKMAPLGDPIEIHIRGYELTLRKEDAQKIEVVPISAEHGRRRRAGMHSHGPHGHRGRHSEGEGR